MVKGHAVEKVPGLQYLQCSPRGLSREADEALTSSLALTSSWKGWAATLGTKLTRKWAPLPSWHLWRTLTLPSQQTKKSCKCRTHLAKPDILPKS